jgi:hypothetical protein
MVRHFYTVIFFPLFFNSAMPVAMADEQGLLPSSNKVWSSLENREVIAEAEAEDAPLKAVKPLPAKQKADVNTLTNNTEPVVTPASAQPLVPVATQITTSVVTDAKPSAEPSLSLPSKSTAPAAAVASPVMTPQDAPIKSPQNLQGEIPYVDSAAEVLSIGAHIYDVKGIGSWQNAHMMGQIRMVITRNSKRDDIYLQWVAWRDDTPKAIVASEAVEGINRDANYRVKAISSQIMQGKPQITLSLEDKYSKEMLRGVIRIIDVGRFECQVLR